MKETIKKLAKGKGERAEQAREMIRLQAQRVEDREETLEDEEISTIDLEEKIMIAADELGMEDLEYLIDLPNDTTEWLRETMDNMNDADLIDLHSRIEEYKAKKKEDKKKRLAKVESKIFKAMQNVAARSIKADRMHKTAKHIANYVINQ